MKKYGLINNIGGWLVFVVSLIVYRLTVESTVSLWDCGEFLSAAYKLQVVHPPGAPLYLMLGRFFALFAGSVENVAFAINMLSAVASSLTVMFTFWITTHLAKKLVGLDVTSNEVPLGKTIQIIGAGLVAAFSLTFIDSFWFSAVEAEVYAASSAFTALAFWLIFKWESHRFSQGSDRWLVLAAYVTGLAIGLHLLNLLVIPALIFYYVFIKFGYSRRNLWIASAIGLGILGFFNFIFIPIFPVLAAKMDFLFVNSFGLSYNTGVIFFYFLLIALIIAGIYYSHQKNKALLNLSLLSFLFVLIGFSTYTMVVIRSGDDPAIDMNNPEDAYSLSSYIRREQYGDRPIFKGPYYNARAIEAEDGAAQYRADEKDGYELIGYKPIYTWEKDKMTIFPRMGDLTEKKQGYTIWSDVKKGETPTMGQNIRFFFKYQLGWMYWRYFMWNFAGRQDGKQNRDGNILHGNWISGIPFIDNMRLGPQNNLPLQYSYDHHRNKYYFIPLILGLIGLFYQYKKRKVDFGVMMTLFLFTGVMIIIFLNQPPLEPRERDYSMVGSFQTFCIWIGLAVPAISSYLSRRMKENTAAGLSIVLALSSPILLMSENWDDHDRSNRSLALGSAKNYLNSCAPNAILFTNGDNDTYPLWYAQNVEGIRTDVRVINLALLSTEWYSDALRYQFYKSEALPFILEEDKYEGSTREILRFFDTKKFNQKAYYPLDAVIKFVGSDDRNKQVPLQSGDYTNYLPVKNFKIAVDKQAVIESETVFPKDSLRLVDEIKFTLPENTIYKGTLIVLDVMAANALSGWKRPIYFTSTSGGHMNLGIDEYLRHEGLAYRLVPIRSNKNQGGIVDTDLLYERYTKDFVYDGYNDPKVNIDEYSSFLPSNLRAMFYYTARQKVIQGDTAKAVELLDFSREKILEENLPMDIQLKFAYLETYYAAGAMDKGDALSTDLFNELKDLEAYYKRFTKPSHKRQVKQELDRVMAFQQEIQKIANNYKRSEIQKLINLENSGG